MSRLLMVTVCALLLPVFGNSFEEVVVETPMGFLKGKEIESVMNGTFHAFFGVPFAKPPVGQLRFMPPQPAEPWEGVRDASLESTECIQMDLITGSSIGKEDCLTVDIFTPKNPSQLKNNPLPVIVIFHGGIFHFGSYSMDESRPDYLMTRDIIVVLVRYRLGVFGFLSFQNHVLPGNAGMKDQVLALKWVRNNIGSFGGDRDCVTIAGFSAGAASAHFHMISPLSRGLFHRVIAASGSAIAPWALARHPVKNAEIMSDVYNCSRKLDLGLLRCLQAVEPEDLTVAQYNAILVERLFTDFNIFLFIPCIEPAHENAFLPGDPFELLAKGQSADVPFLTGTTKDELSVLETVLSLELIPEKLKRQMIVEIFSHPERLIFKEKPYVGSKEMAKAAVQFYFKSQRPSLSNLDAFVKFFSDYYFLLPAWDSLTLHLRHKRSSAFQYVFNFESDQKKTLLTANGVAHGDFYNGFIMYNPANPVDRSHVAFRTIQRAVRIWANFATYGDPTPDDSLDIHWQPAQLDNRFFLDMGTWWFLRRDPEYTRISFWTRARQNENFTV